MQLDKLTSLFFFPQAKKNPQTERMHLFQLPRRQKNDL